MSCVLTAVPDMVIVCVAPGAEMDDTLVNIVAPAVPQGKEMPRVPLVVVTGVGMTPGVMVTVPLDAVHCTRMLTRE
jgi:hypothetical protein